MPSTGATEAVGVLARDYAWVKSGRVSDPSTVPARKRKIDFPYSGKAPQGQPQDDRLFLRQDTRKPLYIWERVQSAMANQNLTSYEADRNWRRFVLFRVFFNSRFYYPVLAILFLDLGLSATEYTLLNFAWAIAIVLTDVPAGVLADRIGRKPLVVAAACFMVLEMVLLGVAPRHGGMVLLACCLANRILSGMAEGMASGADEARPVGRMAARARPGDALAGRGHDRGHAGGRGRLRSGLHEPPGGRFPLVVASRPGNFAPLSHLSQYRHGPFHPVPCAGFA
jgi:hypothetical protein